MFITKVWYCTEFFVLRQHLDGFLLPIPKLHSFADPMLKKTIKDLSIPIACVQRTD